MSDSVAKLEQLENEYSAARTTLLSNALTAEQQKALGEMDKKLDDLRARKTEQERREAGGGGIMSLASAKSDEDTAKAFNSLMPGEKMRLYQEDRSSWQHAIDATEREGMRKLLG